MGSLYIIGNGFDIHHGIPSLYRQFGGYLRANDRQTFEFMMKYFAIDSDFWADFEDRLAAFDANLLIDDASDFLISYGAGDDWKESYNHDYQYEIDEVVKAISQTLRSKFAEWIRQLSMPSTASIEDKRLQLDQAATFLNFNYTRSLQCLYDIADANILHIHGSVANAKDELVLGHGWEPKDEQPVGDPEQIDTRILHGQQSINQYFRCTFKPTPRIIQDNNRFFANLANVQNIFVVGHSVSNADHAYFRKVISSVRSSCTQWKFSYHGNGLADLRCRVEHELGISGASVEYALLTEF